MICISNTVVMTIKKYETGSLRLIFELYKHIKLKLCLPSWHGGIVVGSLVGGSGVIGTIQGAVKDKLIVNTK